MTPQPRLAAEGEAVLGGASVATGRSVVAGVIESEVGVVSVWLDDAHVVAWVGIVVNAVTVKSAAPSPFFHVQHGSPNASPLVIDAFGNVSPQNSGVHECPAFENAVANSVNWEVSLSGCPSSCEKMLPFGSSSRYLARPTAESKVTATIRAVLANLAYIFNFVS